MPSIAVRWSLRIVTIVCLILLILISLTRELPYIQTHLTFSNLQGFKVMFISILLEALPFILIGVIVSALLQTFVSEQMIQSFIPKNPLLGVLYACVIGVIFPICECGMIPIMRRLMRKGMPLYIAIVFIVAGPILNPIVFASTYMAFRSKPEIAYSRMGLAFVAAVIIGLIIYRYVRINPLRQEHREHSHATANAIHHSHNDHDHGGKWRTTLTHSIDEFFEMGKYLLFGAFLAAVIQTVISRDWLVSVGTSEINSHLFMMGFAYVISLCSTSDAFVASSFLSTFTSGSLLSFLVFGPMLDFKSTLMLAAIFSKRFILFLMGLIFVTVLTLSLLLERFIFIT